MQESKVTTKGQTTLPKDVRTALRIKSGDKLRYLLLDGEVRILRARPIRDLKGVLKRSGQAPVSLGAMEEAIAEGATNTSE
ncbi:AbrB/MazE/SpoVT family DNA-binding domain-containing protein [Tateyamaria pelophila]|uniref:AbrB/MazE/SpoVT family DNA-binding domain-containing protein n=1 Tax=Tateyamaria pelophila TaxID=328415 RepID=UPI001CBB67F8|nr:type II toxin-antitoxin system PrlF family antitoxin [Tateyamaria pelophila]